MKSSQLFCTASVALAAAILGGCASAPTPRDNLAANDRRECKIVSYASLAESDAAATRDMRRTGANPNTPAEQALAASEVGKLQVDNPRRFGRPATEPNLLRDARHDC